MRLMRWGLLTVIAVLLAAPVAEAAFPGENGRIAFSRDTTTRTGSTQEDLFSVRPDGTGVRRLTVNEGYSDAPDFSPNGSRIAFSRSGIFTVRPNGRDQRRLTSGQDDSGPAFSPDGGKIAFSANRNSLPFPCEEEYFYRYDSGIWVMNADGTGVRNLTEPLCPVGLRYDYAPTFSPNGKRIAFTRDGDLWRMTPSGERQERLLPNASGPDYSPDGHRIAFARNSGVYLVNEQLRVRRVTRGSQPAFSPNGKRIVFVRAPRGRTETDLFSVRPNGTQVRRLTTSRASEYGPSWGPSP